MSREGCSCGCNSQKEPRPYFAVGFALLVAAAIFCWVLADEGSGLEEADYISTSIRGDGQIYTSDATEVGGTVTYSLFQATGEFDIFKVTSWNETGATQDLVGSMTPSEITWSNRYSGKVSETNTGAHRLEMRSLGGTEITSSLSATPEQVDSVHEFYATDAYFENVIEVPGLDDPIDERTRTYFEGRNVSALVEWHGFVPPAAGGDWLPCFDCTPEFDIQPDWNEVVLFGYGDETCTNCTAEDGFEEEEIVIS